jgi:hypothetical protein
MLMKLLPLHIPMIMFINCFLTGVAWKFTRERDGKSDIVNRRR